MDSSWRPAAAVETVLARSTFLRRIRGFFADRNVIEVQTAMLGACGVTDSEIECLHVENYGYLQPSPEYQMKRLLAAGVPSCYQICPAFRGGETGRWHNPEFTMLEWYRIGFNENALMDEVQKLVNLLLGPCPYTKTTVRDLLLQEHSLDIVHASAAEVEQCAKASGLLGDLDTATQLDHLIALAIESQSSPRAFVYDYPEVSSALARTVVKDGVTTAERFELVVDGKEVANGYHELLDAGELEERMRLSNLKRAELEQPEMALDRRFISAMRSGIPACAGVAVGLDRLFAIALTKASIREVMSFPIDLA